MREHDEACLLAGRTFGGGDGCLARRPAQSGVRRGRQRVGFGGLWLLLVPAACCSGPLLVAGLAVARALAWAGLGLALAALLVGILAVIQLHRRVRAGRGVDSRSDEARPAGLEIPPR